MPGLFIDVEVADSVRGDAELAKKLEEVCPVDIFAATDSRRGDPRAAARRVRAVRALPRGGAPRHGAGDQALRRRCSAGASLTNPAVTPELYRERIGGSFPGDLGIEVVRIEDGEVEGRLAVDRRHLHPGGYVHGGVWVAFADSVAAWGTYRHLAEGHASRPPS